MKEDIQKTILIADDNQGIVLSLSMVLRYGGYLVKTLMDGNEVKKIDMPLPDLILLDIRLGDVNGLEVCQFLKKKYETKHIPIIMISASPDSEKKAFDAGADDFIEKPYSMPTMLNTIAKHLKSPAIA